MFWYDIIHESKYSLSYNTDEETINVPGKGMTAVAENNSSKNCTNYHKNSLEWSQITENRP